MSSVDPALSIDARRHFLHALRRVLRPIVRLLIRHGIGYAEFADVARGAYVESAIRDAVSHGAKPTREQVAHVTGIPRQRVDHYIDDEGALPAPTTQQSDVMSELLHKWHTYPSYLGSSGVPLELEFDAASGPSFRGLVGEIKADANPDTVLDELLTTKSVSWSEERRIRVLTRYFIWQGDSVTSIEYFGSTLMHLIETHEHNFNPANANNKRLDRSVFPVRGLPKHLLRDFQDFARERTDQFLFDIDDWLARFSDTIARQAGPRIETGVNVFFYVEPPPDPRDLSAMVRPSRSPSPPSGRTTVS